MKIKTNRLIIVSLVICGMLAMTACEKKAEPAVEQAQVTEAENVDTTENVEAEDKEETEEPEAEAIEAAEKTESKIDLEDGTYLANFDTDSSMFHVNETLDGKGILTVEDGKATIHIVLTSKNIVNLFEGTVENLDETNLLQPVAEPVTYPDGLEEEVNAFDVNVPYLDEEFDLALIGKKGVWYDHKVSVSNPEPFEDGANQERDEATSDNEQLDDSVKVTLTGGSGKSTVESPAKISTNADGKQIVTIIWSSPNYDYMIVDGEKLLPVNTEGNSTFEIEISEIPCSIDVIADTVAMSKPHEIEYNLTFEK